MAPTTAPTPRTLVGLPDPDEQVFVDAVGSALAEIAPGSIECGDDADGDPRLRSMGLWSFAVPETMGGGGASAAALGEVVRSAGSRLAAGSVLARMLACALLVRCGAADHVARYTAGDVWVTTDLGGSLAAVLGLGGAPPVTATTIGSRTVLDGALELVPHARGADLFVVARDAAGQAHWAVVPAGHPAVEAAEFRTVDPTRRFDRVRLEAVEVGTGDGGPVDHGVVRALLALSAMAVSMDSLGAAQDALDRTVDHVMHREQFGRALGTFQVVQHKCADMLIDVRSAHTAARSVLQAYDDAGADPAEALAVHGYAVRAALRAVETSVQLHGGMGYTWESGQHLRLRRCRVNAGLLLEESARRGVLVRAAMDEDTSADALPAVTAS